MPELPEVETTVRELRQRIVGLKVVRFWTDWPRISRHQSFSRLAKRATGRKVVSVRRRAKYIVIDLEGPMSMVIHQKISGHLLYGKWGKQKGTWVSTMPGPLKDDPKNDYVRLVIWLSNGFQLALSDLRRFGTIALETDGDVRSGKVLEGLGPEPLELSLKEFAALFEKKKGYLKPVLMDPKFIVGIGNIYADEILWYAGLHPKQRIEKLRPNDVTNLFKYMGKVLRNAIAEGGTSADDYRHPNGEKGNFQNAIRAYQRDGKPCGKRDGGILQRIVIGQRSAHFCPKHQKLR